MARKCFVTTCTNTYRKTKNVCVIDEKTCTLTTITYHSFPRDPSLRAKWIKATGRINWVPVNGSTYICSEHFRESDYDIELRAKTGVNTDTPTQLRRVLKKNAIPTQQLGTIMVSGDSEVYLKEDHSLEGELSDISQSSCKEKAINSHSNHLNSVPLVDVKIEPGLENNVHETSVSLTSTLTIKEESNSDDRLNGIFEPEILLGESKSNILEYGTKSGSSTGPPKPKRIKYEEDDLISPSDIKIETSSTPADHNLSLEEKYENLLDQYLSLKNEYDIIKIKYDRQREALNECERILQKCK